MPLETLVEEIRAHGESELHAIAERRDAELATISTERDRAVGALREASARTLEAEAARERAQRLAAAHLEARRSLYEAREALLDDGFAATREALRRFAQGSDYPGVLRRMIASATDRLGRSVRLSGRAEDASVLARLAGKAFDDTARPILGGVIAETPDGRRRLDLSFDELLRQRADAVRALLA